MFCFNPLQITDITVHENERQRKCARLTICKRVYTFWHFDKTHFEVNDVDMNILIVLY